MFKKNNKIAFALTFLAVAGVAATAIAKPNVNSRPDIGQLKTTAGCRPAEGKIDLDINNVRARILTGGDMWWDSGTSEARYEVPKDSRKNSLFAGSVWIGGFDVQGQLKVAAQTYRQSGNDYWPGPLDGTGNIQASDCNDWDRLWKINKATINAFRALPDKAAALSEETYQVIKEWPAKGNQNAIGKSLNPLTVPSDRDMAPFVDVDNNGVYSPATGDYPGLSAEDDLEGDQYIWWVFNDKGNVKGQSLTEGIGIEVQASAFAFSAKDFLNDATFYKYRLINRGNLTLDSTYIATWTDADLGFAYDDFIGCDTSRGLGILYNGKSIDGAGDVNSYGDKIPMVGIDFFKGPIKRFRDPVTGRDTSEELKMEAFTYYTNDNSPQIGNPSNGVQIYNYMTGTIRSGEPFTNDFTGAPVTSKGFGGTVPTKFVFTGDPGVAGEWSECYCNNTYADRRFVHSSGAFRLEPGVVNDIIIGAVWVSDVGGCPNTSFKKIRAADDVAQALFNNNFEAIEGPQAPVLTVREMDKKLVFYLTNPDGSDNYRERFGRDTDAKFRVSAMSSKSVRSADSLYKFEGYRVFQLANRLVTPAQIFDQNGAVDNTLAREVFQTDLKNGIGRIINYTKNTELSDTTWMPVVKVTGRDSGISHSFEVTQDQFATSGSNLINYRNYYFVAIAYAHNEFAPFDPKRPDEGQDVVYLESSKGPGGSPIKVVSAMPNPANGDMGNMLNADFGDGVIIKRLEGRGNGGHELELTKESEEEALAGPTYQATTPEYQPGFGPAQIKVIDPVKIQPHDWELFVEGALQEPTESPTNSHRSRGLSFQSRWKLVNLTDGTTIISESDLGTANEQILQKYGLSVLMKQVLRPGDDQTNGNGYISSFIAFNDPAKAWLAGVNDGEDKAPNNWIRSGGKTGNPGNGDTCNFDDNDLDTVGQFYERMLSNNAATLGTWAPYQFTNDELKNNCHVSLAYSGSLMSRSQFGLAGLPSVDVVFTSDKSKWTRCLVVEMQNSTTLAEGNAGKFEARKHAGWNLDVDANGRPVYSANPADNGMSWFPGYAINQETGERLNIMFGEDTWLKSDNGADMIWNPTSVSSTTDEANVLTEVYGGKHVVYVMDSRYDAGVSAQEAMKGDRTKKLQLYRKAIYVGFPLLAPGFQFTSIADGMIPTETRLKFRIERPYAKYDPQNGLGLRNGGLPLYSFSTRNLAPTPIADNKNVDKQALLDRITAVPNPYYGYSGYEMNNLDTKVRIINLPKRATVSVYSLDGSLVARLEKDNANTSYIDWNVRNTKGLPIASGMYLMHVEAAGIGETVVRWFGAMRPINVTQY